MLHERILDPHLLESDTKEEQGLGIISGEVTFAREKVLAKGAYSLFGLDIMGYEIHYARAKEIAVKQEKLYATFIHGLFDNDNFRALLFRELDESYEGYCFLERKKEEIESFTNEIDTQIDMDQIVQSLRVC